MDVNIGMFEVISTLLSKRKTCEDIYNDLISTTRKELKEHRKEELQPQFVVAIDHDDSNYEIHMMSVGQSFSRIGTHTTMRILGSSYRQNNHNVLAIFCVSEAKTTKIDASSESEANKAFKMGLGDVVDTVIVNASTNSGEVKTYIIHLDGDRNIESELDVSDGETTASMLGMFWAGYNMGKDDPDVSAFFFRANGEE